MTGSDANGSPEILVQAYLDGTLADDGIDRLREWLAEPGHMVEFVRQLDVHASLLERFEGLNPESSERPEALRVYGGARRPIGLRRLVALGAAAGLLLCVGLAVWMLARPGPVPLAKVVEGEIAIQRGEDRFSAGGEASLFADDHLSVPEGAHVRLSDGSVLKLDKETDMVLRRPRDGERADMKILRGRLFLRVAKASGAFRIAGSAVVSVLGTVFGVSEGRGRTSVDVLRGRVELASVGKKIVLARGQSGAAAEQEAPARTGADPNQALIWARERIVFEDRPLGEVLDWIEANSSYRFDLSGRRRSSTSVSVTVADEPMREVIEAVMLSCGLDYRFEKHDIQVR
jgi:ferric-dicitrate binding protein FerR (iron transport regulator)